MTLCHILVPEILKFAEMDFLDPRNHKAFLEAQHCPVSPHVPELGHTKHKVHLGPFTPTGLPVFLPLCQPGAHLLWLHRWNSSHLPGPQPALPRQPAQATLPRGRCGPGPGPQVLPGRGRVRGPTRVCLLISFCASTLACPGQETGYSYNEAAKSLPL